MKNYRSSNAALCLSLSLFLAACATGPETATNNTVSAAGVGPGGNHPPATGTGGPPTKLESQVTQAATAPLSDLNLVRADIPPVLQAAQRAPYGLPAEISCTAIGGEVQALDAVLGADLDTPVVAVNPSLIERGTDAVGDAAVRTVRGVTEKVVPFRSWVRKLSGAERYSQEVSAAIAAGTIRRAYLKGLGLAKGCPAPAAPLR